MQVPIAALPEDLSLDAAVEAAYADVFEEVEAALRQARPLLLECDPTLVPHLAAVLRRRLSEGRAGRALGCRLLDGGTGEGEVGRRILEALRAAIVTGDTGAVLVVPHLELVAPAAADGSDGPAARAVAELLAAEPQLRLVACHAPWAAPPPLLARAFAVRGGVGGVPCERLPRVVLQREARKLGVETFDAAALHAVMGDLDVVRLRSILERAADRLDYDPRAPDVRAALHAELAAAADRARVTAAGRGPERRGAAPTSILGP